MKALDLAILLIYFGGMLALGVYFSKSKKVEADRYSKTGKPIPGWALGLSFYATFLSAITFLGDPGKAYASNWNPFVFSLSMPFAAYFSAKYFVPFYRNSDTISAYTHLGVRFGNWARNYAIACFILTQLARIGTILYAIALTINALTGYPIFILIGIIALVIIIYTLIGGLEAVIWTEVCQAIIKTMGACLVLYLVLSKIGVDQVFTLAQKENKFSLGSFQLHFSESSFWVVFLYGFFINLGNFGIDQNYVQRYHSAANEQDAARSIWLCVWYYVPVSALFFFIGSCLYAYYNIFPALLQPLIQKVALDKQIAIGNIHIADYADSIFPYFIKTEIPTGLLGLLVAAILSAGMSAVSNGINSAATVLVKDIFPKGIQNRFSELQIIKASIIAMGAIGMLVAWVMVGSKSLLDVWWKLAGALAGGMLGLFLLGLLAGKGKLSYAPLALSMGVMAIIAISFPDLGLNFVLLDTKMNISIGTVIIILVGLLARPRRK